MTDKSSIDAAVPNEALVVAGQRTKEATVGKARQGFLVRSRRELVELFGKLDWDGDFDYKRERVRR